MAEQMGVAGRVIFAGSTDQPADFYRAADFFVLPTRRDSCSLVVLEALAMGLPVISTVGNGACEVMANGTHGFVLDDPADVPALADAMRRLLGQSARQTLRQACLDLHRNISQEQHVRRMVAIYEEIVQERKPR
jgi:UDP-glucose:(heptosyl)LPS alpha-1,3-glucosyltransferase